MDSAQCAVFTFLRQRRLRLLGDAGSDMGSEAGGGTKSVIRYRHHHPRAKSKKGQKQHDYLYWEFDERGGAKAVLKGNWKGVRRNTRKNPNSPIEIYNLKNNLAETTNLAETQKKLLEEFKAVLKREHIAQ